MASQNKKKKRRLRPEAAALLYAAGCIALTFLLYGTVFARVYTDPAEKVFSSDTSQTSDSSTASAQTDDTTDDEVLASNEAGEKLLTDYEDQGEISAVVLLDAGHGGFDAGNVSSDGDLEKTINLKFTKMVQKALTESNPNIEVKMIRSDDNVFWADNDWDDLAYRVEQQTETGADYYFSFHCNSFDNPEAKGYSFYINNGDTVMESIADLMNQYLAKVGFSTYHSTVTTDNHPLQVVSLSPINSMLVELAFMSNAEDMALLRDDEALAGAADALAAAISDYIMGNTDKLTLEDSDSAEDADSQDSADQSETDEEAETTDA